MRHRSPRARSSTPSAGHRSPGGRHRSEAARGRMPRPALALGEHLGRPAVVCSLAVVALGVSSVLTQGLPSSAVAPGGSPASMAFLLGSSSGGALVASPATSAGTAGSDRSAGGSPLDPAGAPPRTHRGDLPVNTLVAPAQPATVLDGGRFGWRIAPDLGKREFHNGTDISAPAGTPVVAAAQGRVTAVFWDVWGGNRVEVAHADGLRTTYSHLEDVRVEVGDDLAAAQRLGSVGATGIRVTGPHLHFETWVDGAVADPQSFDWLTDAGIVPGTATPYSLADEAPSPAAVAEFLRRSLSGGDEVQVMASSPGKATVAQPASPTPESTPKDAGTRDAEQGAEKNAPEHTRSWVGDEAAESAPRTTQETSTTTGPRSEREPSATEPVPTAPQPSAEPTTRPEPAPMQPAEQPARQLPAAPAPAPALTAEPTPGKTPAMSPAPTPEEQAAQEAAQRAEELRLAQRTYTSPTADTDGDGVVDPLDDDLDGDGIVNALDTDLDGDGVLNADEAAQEHVWRPADPGASGAAPSNTATPATATTGTPAAAS